MNSVKRAKRDTAENIYRSCRMGGDCPPDVVNKIENKTLADILLQAFSSVLFLGNLGIGTGKGVGVRPTPIPETIAPSSRPVGPQLARPSVTRPSRPFSVPLDTIGIGSRPIDPIGSRAVDIVDPTSPAIVPLNESLPDTVITLGEPAITTTNVSELPDLSIITDTTSIQSHPTVITRGDNEVAIINVTPADPPPTRVIYSSSSFINPAFSVESTVGHIDPDINVFVDPLITGETISFGEEIPLQPINPIQEFEIEEPPATSTPGERFNKLTSRVKQFYNRYTQQNPTRNIDFLSDVSRAVQFGFENPAFNADVTLEFEQDVNEVAAAPDIDFAGIRTISRPYFSTTPNRTIRVSRLGTKGGVSTRSGIIVGQPVHYYYDLSTIEEIELPTLTQSSTGLIELSTESTFIDASGLEYPELLDTYGETFDNAHLILETNTEEADNSAVPVYVQTSNIKPFVYDISNAININSINSVTITTIPEAKIVPNNISPAIIISFESEDYNLHPSLLKKRSRKRKRLDVF